MYSNINGDIALKPDPPGDDDFVYHHHVDSHFDTTGSMSTMKDPPPSVILLNNNHGGLPVPQNIVALPPINEEDCSHDVSSNDPPLMDDGQ